MITLWRRAGRPAGHVLLSALIAVGVLGSMVVADAGATTAATTADPGKKIDPAVSRALATKDGTDFWVSFSGKSDLAKASRQPGWAARGASVVKALKSTADRSQAATRSKLRADKVDFTAYHIVNAILVRDGDRNLARELAERPEVARILPTRTYQLHRPTASETDTDPGTDSVAWGVDAINADDVWSGYGVRGEGIVVATIDTGVDYRHPALAGRYRGNAGGGAYDHNYNWYDPSQVCPSPAPCDNNAHGTHTMGTMVGDDDTGNQIGVAPGARWIAAKGCESNGCSDYALLAAGEWVLAPTDLNGQNPRPDLRPNIVNNSWGSRGGDPWYADIVAAWRASGIFPAFSNGNSGPGCDSSGSPADYVGSYASGAFDVNGAIARFSSRGPGRFGDVKPDLAAPGVDVRSAVPGGSYAMFSGTSMASPHTAGTVALMWSAAPILVGDLDETARLLDTSAVDNGNTNCGGTAENNNIWGEGRLDAYAAVSSAPRGSTGQLTGTITDATTGAAVPGATIEVVGARRTTSDAGGGYRLTLVAGDYDLTVSAYGYRQASGQVTVAAGETTSQDFALALTGRFQISGVVRDAAGDPLPYATVTVLDTAVPPAMADADGAYRLTDVPEGSYRVRGDAGNCTEQRILPVTLTADATLDFALPQRGDTFGYRCTVERQPYVEADTPTGLVGDDRTTAIDLPFDFTLYGNVYRRAYLSSNGFLNFQTPAPVFANQQIPITQAPNAAIYPFWDDLVVDFASRVNTTVIGTAPHRQFVVEYRDITFYTLDSRIDFEMLLGEDGDIEFRYRGLDPGIPVETGSRATVGIENSNGADALQYSYDAGDLTDSRSIHFHAPASARVTGVVTDANDGEPLVPAWVSTSYGGITLQTTTAADGSYSLGLPLGTYPIKIFRGMYETDIREITLTENGQVFRHDAALRTALVKHSPSSLEFLAQPGQLRSTQVTLSNPGALPLTYQIRDDVWWNEGVPWMWTTPAQGTVAPGESATLTVRVDASEMQPGAYEGLVTVQTNAGRDPFINIPVTLAVPAYRTGVDAGGGAYTDTAGDSWSGDQPWTAGGFGYVGDSSTNTTRKSIAGTEDDVLLRTSREGMTGYRFDALPAGTYQVELSFAELRQGLGAGRCVFDVAINGETVLRGHDVVAAVGTLTADTRTFWVTVADGGSITIDFGSYRGKLPPYVNAVRVTHRPDR